jgi:hypothetical protein
LDDTAFRKSKLIVKTQRSFRRIRSSVSFLQ